MRVIVSMSLVDEREEFVYFSGMGGVMIYRGFDGGRSFLIC